MKRLFDIFVSVMGLVCLAPVLLIVAVAVVLESGFPVMFLQRRVGLNCTTFTIFKFRSMKVGKPSSGMVPENGKYSREELAEMRRKYQTTSAGDARITRVGKLLRRCYLDELPQFVNVLAGHMSLIGPRPDAPVQEVDYSAAEWRARHAVRPGITGLAQVCGGKSNTLQRRTRLDLLYARRPGFCRDMWILYRTVVHAIFKGSY